MTDNMNSYNKNMVELTKEIKDTLNYIQGINESFVSENDVVDVGDNKIPSLTAVSKKLDRVENTIAKFTKGKGVIETDDGTYRKIKVSTISSPPSQITNLNNILNFNINPNWFFESLQYPQCIVKVDLKNKIDDDSDRVYINRIILDSTDIPSTNSSMLEFYNDYIINKNLTYPETISIFEKYSINYREDKEEIKLPLTFEKYKGEFEITDVNLIKDDKGISKKWYILNTVNYSLIDENGVEINNSYTLNIGDYLRYANSLFKIIDINTNQKRVRLDYAVGYESIGFGMVMEFYNTPFSEKIIEIGIGIDEIDIIYIKGVNEEYNLLAREWSDPITFYTNNLVFEDNDNISFNNYYIENVSDFGKNLIAQAKEKNIFAYHGIIPNIPTLVSDNLKVVQINTQLEVTLDSNTYNNLTSEIANIKSTISSLRTTISTNKTLLIQSSSSSERTNLQNTINSDTESLNSYTTQYNSLVEELNTLLNESGAINYTPKYHIRGFFGIPDPQYTDETNKLGEQLIIGFEIMYRYLHTDETGIKLDTYNYNISDNIIQSGIFTDWNLIVGTKLSKKYDASLGIYIWTNQNTLDGTEININQIDIPIQKGEKVEIKVRSISEAGYPSNPLKSDWSNSIIISFPDNLTSVDSVTNILNSVKDDMTAIVLQETMSAAGIYTHLNDTNSSYKHISSNISFTDSVTDTSTGKTSLTEMSVQEKLTALSNNVSSVKNEYESYIKENMELYTKNIIIAINSLKTVLGYTDMPNTTDASYWNNPNAGTVPVLDSTSQTFTTFANKLLSNSEVLNTIINAIGINNK